MVLILHLLFVLNRRYLDNCGLFRRY